MATIDWRTSINVEAFLLRLRAAGWAGSVAARFVREFGAERAYHGKHEILRSGAKTERVLVLVAGWACRYRLLSDGRRHIIKLLLPGDICNADALFWDRPVLGIAALTPCKTAEIAVDRLRSLTCADADVAENWNRLMLLENALLGELNASLGRRTARERLAHLLCELYLRLATVGKADTVRFRLPITQEDLGDTLGLTSVHVNRMLHALRADRLIGTADHCVTILDWQRLKGVAAFDDAYLHIAAPVEAHRHVGGAESGIRFQRL